MKKLLIITGGGVYGCIPAHFLGSLPESCTLDGVDLLAGTSIGGILAAAYAAGNTFQEVDRCFLSRHRDCFKRRFLSVLNPLSVPKYDSEALHDVIADIVGPGTMASVRSRFPKLDLVIPALNITDDVYKVYDNITGQDDDESLVDIACRTSAAPSYFEGLDVDGKCIVDGGLIEVSPLLTAATALKGKRGIPFHDMSVLVIGAGRDVSRKPLTPKRYEGLSLLGIATDLIVPYATLGNWMATKYWGENMGFGYFKLYNPVDTTGELDDTDQVVCSEQCVDKHIDEFRAVWDEWYTSK